jgi:hypothetical protein
MFELADATAERELLNQQYLSRAPKVAMIRCRHRVSKMLQIDVGRAITINIPGRVCFNELLREM